jgi:hypothetical protein
MPAANRKFPSVADLIREHWAKSTSELQAIILQHHPKATIPEIVAAPTGGRELRRGRCAGDGRSDRGNGLMARRDTAALAAMSWPQIGRNRWFDKRWIDPPSRMRRPGQGGSADLDGTIVSWNDTDNNKTQRQGQRAAAEALFAREVA